MPFHLLPGVPEIRVPVVCINIYGDDDQNPTKRIDEGGAITAAASSYGIKNKVVVSMTREKRAE